MKLGLIYHQFVRAGGLENYLIEFAARLQGAGHELHIVTARVADDVKAKLNAQWHLLKRPPSPLLRLAHFDRAAAAAAKSLPVDTTIGFGRTSKHDWHRAGGGCHAIYSKLLPWWKRYTVKNLLELHLEKKLYQGGGTQHFVMNSAQVVRQIEAHYPAARGKCHVVHTAVDTQQYRPADDRAAHRAQVCQTLQTDASKPVCLFVSLSHRRKGLDALLHAWQGMDATLWIAGRALDARYRGLIERLGIADKVRALPPTSNIAALYQAADWFVHPTLYDACANTALQSMACGLPGLISINDGATDHVRDGENGFLLQEPANAEALRASIQQALAVPEDQRLAMGARARETMLPHTWDAHVACWMKLLQA